MRKIVRHIGYIFLVLSLCFTGLSIRKASAQTSANEIVVYASTATTKVGNYQVVSDTTAAGGARMWNPDAGAAKQANPLASPTSYFELTFNAQAGVAYHLWIRGKADGDSTYNDSVYVQFS